MNYDIKFYDIPHFFYGSVNFHFEHIQGSHSDDCGIHTHILWSYRISIVVALSMLPLLLTFRSHKNKKSFQKGFYNFFFCCLHMTYNKFFKEYTLKKYQEATSHIERRELLRNYMRLHE